ncbi:MAG: hypothetical protein KIT52_20115 [Anaerolineae bacterium]|nr:hypothetical protein [Anaerolineae bacterium]
MSLLPILLVGALLAAAVVCAVAARRLPTAAVPSAPPGRAHLLVALAVFAPLLAWLVWPGARAGDRAAAWQLTGSALWLLAVVVAWLALGRAVDGRVAGQLAAAFGLTAALLPALWATDERARVIAVALLAAAWLATQWRIAGWTTAVWPVVGLPAAAMLLWAAAAVGGAAAAVCVVAAAVLLLGLWPLADALWGPHDMAPLLAGLPALAGAALLLPVARGGALPPGLLAAATAVGLLAAVVGLARLGQRSPGGVARALAPALGGLALVAGVWGGAAALLPAVRLAVFAPAALALLGPAVGRGRWARLAVVAVAYAALAGLPLTAGFGALAPLYALWLPGGGVLLAITVGVLGLWLAVVILGARVAGEENTTGQPLLAALLPAALAAAALFRLDVSGLALPPAAWVVVALPALIGTLLGRFAPGLWDVGDLARESFAAGALTERLGARLGPPARRAGAATAAALADAVNILEGENGLLLLLALLALLLWLGR